jgi:2-polyprenyl-6-methoxyphenol hydroxylase-like FAD-dependent oxidoreductase
VAGVVIVGAGIGGLATALLLGREGRDVVVCERDPAQVPTSTEEMWSGWKRPGIPQAPLGHTFLPGFRMLLTERAPDVVERLYAAGAPLVDFAKGMPGDERRPQDAELHAIMCRRAVLEGILRQAVAAEPTVEIRPGCDVVGLVAEPSPMAGVPRVVGVRARGQSAIAADTVVVSGGRLVPVPRWLEAIGAHAPEEFSEGCGFVTFTRFFRINLRPDEDHRVATRLTVEGDPGYMSYEMFGADASTFCVELSPQAWDRELRGLRHEAVHMAAARTLPESEDWLDPARATPIGPVAAMGQERNVLRHFVTEGRPVALGLHVIGDARCQLDSLYAWGSGVALSGAVTLVDVLAEHRGDPEAQALAFEDRLGAEITGRHELSLARDRAHARRYRGEPEWDEPETGLGLIQSTVVPAADEDADVFRAVRRRDMQLDPVGALAQNTAVIDRARALTAAREPERKTAPAPARERLLELIAQAGVPAVE